MLTRRYLLAATSASALAASGQSHVAYSGIASGAGQTSGAPFGFAAVGGHAPLLASAGEASGGGGQAPASPAQAPATPPAGMELGAFSISLAVKDLQASKQFYEKLGFKSFMGDSKNWVILRNADHVIGLFQGMFEKNVFTFNPGWDQNTKKLPAFTDVREIQRRLKAQGVKIVKEADESSTGPASFMTEDPDGNQILFDQHV